MVIQLELEASAQVCHMPHQKANEKLCYLSLDLEHGGEVETSCVTCHWPVLPVKRREGPDPTWAEEQVCNTQETSQGLGNCIWNSTIIFLSYLKL